MLDNASAFELTELPKSMIVLGGGPTGLEVAQIFAHLGTKVIHVDAKERMLAVSEPEVSDAIQRIFSNEEVEVYTSTRAIEVRTEGNEIALAVEQNGSRRELRAEKLFVAIGVTTEPFASSPWTN